MSCRNPTPEAPLGVLKRTLAAALAGMVLLLTVLAVSPAAHERLHAHTGDADHACAVTLFAQGITSPIAYVAVPQPLERAELAVRPLPTAVWLVSPRYLLKPLRGPPFV